MSSRASARIRRSRKRVQRVRLRPAPSSDESLTEHRTASIGVHWLNEETQPQRWTTRIVSLGRTQPAAKRGGTSTRYRTPSILKHTAASPRGLVGCSRALSENHLRSTKINPRSFDPDETKWFEKEARFRPGLNRRVSRKVRPRKSLSHSEPGCLCSWHANRTARIKSVTRRKARVDTVRRSVVGTRARQKGDDEGIVDRSRPIGESRKTVHRNRRN